MNENTTKQYNKEGTIEGTKAIKELFVGLIYQKNTKRGYKIFLFFSNTFWLKSRLFSFNFFFYFFGT
jgi:hypothetical protein